MANRLLYVIRLRDQATLSWSKSVSESKRLCDYFNERGPIATLSTKPGRTPELSYPPPKTKLRKSAT